MSVFLVASQEGFATSYNASLVHIRAPIEAEIGGFLPFTNAGRLLQV